MPIIGASKANRSRERYLPDYSCNPTLIGQIVRPQNDDIYTELFSILLDYLTSAKRAIVLAKRLIEADRYFVIFYLYRL